MNTLDYIEFVSLCNLSYLEERLFASTELSWLSYNTYHFIRKYNFRGEYMVHEVYICSNMKSPLILQQCDEVEAAIPLILSYQVSLILF